MITLKITPHQESELNAYVEQHLANCYEFLEYENDNMSNFEPFAPYCGCHTCQQRETLHAAFHWLEENNIISLQYDDSNKD